jgi:prepilin-type N-terminal cleavage/methylation domain-containing protein
MHRRFHTIQAASGGFTLIELMVTITIIVLVTGIVMVRYSSFNSSVLLTGQAYITAFDLREAQSLAISVRGNGREFREDYGIYINMATQEKYILFQDDNDNGDYFPARYDAGEEVGNPYTLDPRFTIQNICAENSAGRTCYADDPDTTGEVVDPSLSTLAITFKRPDFDAAFYTPAKSNIQSVDIIIAPHDGELEKKVVVYATGQISVE